MTKNWGAYFITFAALLLLQTLMFPPVLAAELSLSQEITKLRKSKGLPVFNNEPRLTLAARKIADRLAKKGTRSVPQDFLGAALRTEHYIWASAQAYISFVPKGEKRLLADILKQPNANSALLSKNSWEIGAARFKNPYHLDYSGTSDVLVVILAKPSISATKGWQEETLRLVNNFRAKYNLAPLKINNKLNKAAQAHADDMFVRDFFAHISPSGTGPGDRASKQGYKWRLILENLATGQTSPAEAVKGWENSKTGHREAMLNPNIREAGIGYRYMSNDNGKYNGHHYWAMSMGLQ